MQQIDNIVSKAVLRDKSGLRRALVFASLTGASHKLYHKHYRSAHSLEYGKIHGAKSLCNSHLILS